MQQLPPAEQRDILAIASPEQRERITGLMAQANSELDCSDRAITYGSRVQDINQTKNSARFGFVVGMADGYCHLVRDDGLKGRRNQLKDRLDKLYSS